jgi:hypothetical protein
MSTHRSSLVQGVLAGMTGAAVLALWFFIADLQLDQPFRTPAFLARVIGLGDVGPAPLPIVLYSLVHIALFIGAGIVTVRAVERLGSTHVLLLGPLLGVVLFTLVLYGSVAIRGFDVMAELGWAPVLLGNLIAGLAMAGVLRAAGLLTATDWRSFFDRHAAVRDGMITGLLGAAAVAAWFFIVDTAEGRVLFTPAALGSAAFLGARSAAQVEISASVVLGYTVLHLVLFLTIGITAARLAAAARDSRVVLLGAALLAVTLQVLAIGLLAILAVWLVDALAWWNIAVANLVAVLAMGSYLYASHPDLARELLSGNAEADLAAERSSHGP